MHRQSIKVKIEQFSVQLLKLLGVLVQSQWDLKYIINRLKIEKQLKLISGPASYIFHISCIVHTGQLTKTLEPSWCRTETNLMATNTSHKRQFRFHQGSNICTYLRILLLILYIRKTEPGVWNIELATLKLLLKAFIWITRESGEWTYINLIWFFFIDLLIKGHRNYIFTN